MWCLERAETTVKCMLGVPNLNSSCGNLSTQSLAGSFFVFHQTHLQTFHCFDCFNHPNKTPVASLASLLALRGAMAGSWCVLAPDTEQDHVKCFAIAKREPESCRNSSSGCATVSDCASLTYICFQRRDVKHAGKRHFISPASTSTATRTFIKSDSLWFSFCFWSEASPPGGNNSLLSRSPQLTS